MEAWQVLCTAAMVSRVGMPIPSVEGTVLLSRGFGEPGSEGDRIFGSRIMR